MKCRHFFSFVLVVFLSFFFGSFITTHNTFAVDDYVVEVNQSNYSSYLNSKYLCGSNSGIDCSDYSYFIVDIIEVSSMHENASFSIRFLPGGRYSDFSFASESQMVIHYYDFVSSIYLSSPNYLYQGTFSFRIILSDSLPGSTAPPSGNLDITSNGTYDVTEYAQATVNVPAEVIQGDYHNDLVNINQSIIVCGAILLVLYFFYCIYRLIIKNSGVH